jgi:DNA invertase Pin-like site-specific DNA recombinase
MRAAGYIRVSTTEQVEEGVSLAAQERALRDYATRVGFDLVVIYRDEGVSAGIPLAQRAGGAQLVSAVQQGDIAHVIAAKLDRAFRNAGDCTHTVEQWVQAGVNVHLLDLNVDTGTPSGLFILQVMAACAQLELNQIRERTCIALAHKKQQGDRLGTTPLGYETPAPGEMMIPNESELEIVYWIIDQCDADRPFTDIARELTARGVATKRGGKWHASTVRAIWLRKRTYARMERVGVGAPGQSSTKAA